MTALDLTDQYTMAGPVLREVAQIIRHLGVKSDYYVKIDTGTATLVSAMSIITDIFLTAVDGNIELAATMAESRADAYDQDLNVLLSRKDR
jgi:hypothetical protein